MATATNVHSKQPQAAGIDMSTLATQTDAYPSPASGIRSTALVDGTAASYSPGAVLGTGMNTDTYTPGAEAV
jgi:hypothetical protein